MVHRLRIVPFVFGFGFLYLLGVHALKQILSWRLWPFEAHYSGGFGPAMMYLVASQLPDSWHFSFFTIWQDTAYGIKKELCHLIDHYIIIKFLIHIKWPFGPKLINFWVTLISGYTYTSHTKRLQDEYSAGSYKLPFSISYKYEIMQLLAMLLLSMNLS